MNGLKLLALCAKGERRHIARVLALEWLSSALAVAPNGLIIWMVWQLVIKHNISQQFWWLLALLAGLFGLQLLLAPAVITRTNNLAYHLSCRLRVLLACHASQLSLGVYGSQRLGTFADRLNQAINRFEFVLSHSLTNLLAAISTPVLLLALLAWLDWRLALVILASLICAIALQHLINTWLAQREARVQRSHSALRSEMLDLLDMLPALKSYAAPDYWQHRYQRLADVAARAQLQFNLLVQPFSQLTGLVLDVGFVLTLWLGIILFMSADLSLVNLLVFTLIGYRVMEPVKVLLADWLLLRQMDDELATVTRLLQQRPLPVSAKGGQVSSYNIRCSGLVFAYADQSTPVLRGLSADFPTGTTTALVGLSGTGKTTLLQLLMRFWDPQQGNISIGGVELTALEQDAIAALFAPVFQQPYLFNDSLINNVRFGRPEASTKELQDALQAAGCSWLAQQLPHGLETHIGEGGKLLSRGQQQLIAIARCLLKQAPIVLFDEATAALDPQNSHMIYQAMERLSQGKTRIVIAHDLARMQHADNILVLDKGVIAEQGTHRELLQVDGVYAGLWQRQQAALGWHIETSAQPLRPEP